MSGYRLTAAAAALVLLVACGQSPYAPSAAQEQSRRDAGAAPATAPSTDPDADMVTAVSVGSSSTPISVKFRIEARPVVGMPVKIVVAVIPAATAQINHIHGSFLPGAGLQLQSESERNFDAADVRSGAVLYRELTVVPQQTGVLSLSATILIDQDNGSQARTYSIPLIATDSTS